MDTYMNTYADFKCKGRVSIFSNDKAIDMYHKLVFHDRVNIYFILGLYSTHFSRINH